MKTCPKCKDFIHNDVMKCKCGFEFHNYKRCPDCGKRAKGIEKICKCGFVFITGQSSSTQKNEKSTAKRLEITCSVCCNKFIIEITDELLPFVCKKCKTIFLYEDNNGSIKIELLRKGKYIPGEMEQEYMILGIDNIILDKTELKKAWRKQIELYHPDKVANLGDDFMKLATEKVKEINNAYERITEWIDKQETQSI